MGEGATIMQTEVGQLHGRVTVIETKLEGVMSGISDLTKVVRAMADQPRALPLKEVALTILACFGVFSYVGSFLEGQYAKNAAVDHYRIEQLEKRLHQLLIKP
jgi:hypothetical protein